RLISISFPDPPFYSPGWPRVMGRIEYLVLPAPRAFPGCASPAKGTSGENPTPPPPGASLPEPIRAGDPPCAALHRHGADAPGADRDGGEPAPGDRRPSGGGARAGPEGGRAHGGDRDRP